MPPPRTTKALLFDLGGVLIEIDFARALHAWAPFSQLSDAGLRATFRQDEHYERHERGQIGSEAYFRHLIQTLQLNADVAEVERGWNSIFVREIVETRTMLEVARRQIPCFSFTNTNASHMATWTQLFPEVLGVFDNVFASYQLGLRKPEREAFARISELTAISPEHIVFFDDLQENVDGAVAAGLQGILVRSPDDVRSALQSLGLAEVCGET